MYPINVYHKSSNYNMDHTIYELADCVYDYLASHPHEPKTYMEIYDDISSDSGHRCSALQNPSIKSKSKDTFILICYSLKDKYDNIHDIVNNDIPFLMFSLEPPEKIVWDFGNYNNYHYPDSILIDEVINLISQNSSNNKLTVDEQLLKYLIVHSKYSMFEKIIHIFNIDENILIDGKSLIELAIIYNQATIVKLLMDRKIDNTKNTLNTKITQLEKINNKLNLDKLRLTTDNRNLTHTLQNKYSLKHIVGCFVITCLCNFMYSALF